MGIEAAIIAASVITAGGVVMSNSMNKGGGKITQAPPVKEITAEPKRKEVFSEMAKLRKQTLIAKRDTPEPMTRKTILGAGI